VSIACKSARQCVHLGAAGPRDSCIVSERVYLFVSAELFRASCAAGCALGRRCCLTQYTALIQYPLGTRVRDRNNTPTDRAVWSSRVGLARDAVLCRPRRRRVRLLAGLDGGRGCRVAASSAMSQSRVKSAWRDRSARDIEARQGQSNSEQERFGDLRGRLPGTWTERTTWRRAALPSLPWVVCFLSFFFGARASPIRG